MSFDANENLTVDCPNGHSFEAPLRELRTRTTCPICRAQFDGSQLDRDVARVERRIADFEKGLGRITLRF